MNSLVGLKEGLKQNLDAKTFSRKIYLAYPTEVLIGKEEIQFAIFNNIKLHLNINYSDIQVCGSSKTGISFIEDRVFLPGVSDLDIAIINSSLYQIYLEAAHEITKSFTDLSYFPTVRKERSDKQFLKNISKGYLNPYYMPLCNLRSNWLSYFRVLSNKYYKLFRNINASLYSSEYFFESKQEYCITRYKINPVLYDQIPG